MQDSSSGSEGAMIPAETLPVNMRMRASSWRKLSPLPGGKFWFALFLTINVCTASILAPVSALAGPIQVAQYCDNCDNDRPPPRSRETKGEKLQISLETVLKWSLAINVIQAIAIVVMALRFSNRGPTIDLSNLKLEGKLGKDG
jgi:hypothetical protein